MAENDLILGDGDADFDQDDYYENQSDVRQTIDTAIYVYNFIEEIDLDSPDLITWRLKNKLRMTKKKCLKILIECIDELDTSPEEEES